MQYLTDVNKLFSIINYTVYTVDLKKNRKIFFKSDIIS